MNTVSDTHKKYFHYTQRKAIPGGDERQMQTLHKI